MFICRLLLKDEPGVQRKQWKKDSDPVGYLYAYGRSDSNSAACSAVQRAARGCAAFQAVSGALTLIILPNDCEYSMDI